MAAASRDAVAAASRDAVPAASRDAVQWVWAALAAPLSDAQPGVVVGRDVVPSLSDALSVGVGAAAVGAAVGDGPLRLALRLVWRSVPLRLVLGAGATTVRNGTAFNG